jgi:hypothetical protein
LHFSLLDEDEIDRFRPTDLFDRFNRGGFLKPQKTAPMPPLCTAQKGQFCATSALLRP